MNYFLIALLSLTMLLGCSTSSKKRNAISGVAFIGGTLVGGASAPPDEKKEMHAIYWGSLVGLSAALISNLYINDDKELESVRDENERLKKELEMMSQGPTSLLKETTTSGGKSKIKLYKVDQWVNEGPNKKYHRDQVIEVIPNEKGP